jgi:ferredoxin
MSYKFLSQAELDGLVSGWVAAGTKVIAPVRGKDGEQPRYQPVQKLAEATLGVEQPRHSLKEFFLPPTEVLLSYTLTQEGVELKEVPTKAQPQVILGALPCDAAALEVVDKVMNWDYRDELWMGRREATTMVSLLCSVMDSSCFCSAIGLGPEATRGSDVMLMPVEGGYLAQVITPKGEALLKDCPAAADDAVAAMDAARSEAKQKVEKNLPALSDDLPGWIEKNFNHSLWKTIALRCHGCGACAGVCPTCHCFDIADERSGSEQGERRRNWDSCQTALFTQHASGHNPRATQSERYRQRVVHKFSIYPKRFDEILCTGCGRCIRVCPSGMDIREIVGDLAAMAKAEAESGPGENA